MFSCKKMVNIQCSGLQFEKLIFGISGTKLNLSGREDNLGSSRQVGKKKKKLKSKQERKTWFLRLFQAPVPLHLIKSTHTHTHALSISLSLAYSLLSLPLFNLFSLWFQGWHSVTFLGTEYARECEEARVGVRVCVRVCIECVCCPHA